jgi:hypothetical protein
MKCAEYDPARAGKTVLPDGPFDVVTCIDVMEHVEEAYVAQVLKQVAARAGSVAYFLISLVKAVHRLPDGRNAHLTVKPQKWWTDRLSEHFGTVKVLREKSTWFTCECEP